MTIPATSSHSTEQAACAVQSERTDTDTDTQSEFSTPRALSPIERKYVVVFGAAMLILSLVTLGVLVSQLVPLIQLIGELSG